MGMKRFLLSCKKILKQGSTENGYLIRYYDYQKTEKTMHIWKNMNSDKGQISLLGIMKFSIKNLKYAFFTITLSRNIVDSNHRTRK